MNPGIKDCQNLGNKNAPENPNLLVVKENKIISWESECQIINSKLVNNGAEVKLTCSGEGENWKLNTKFIREGNTINFGEIGNNQKYLLCDSTLVKTDEVKTSENLIDNSSKINNSNKQNTADIEQPVIMNSKNLQQQINKKSDSSILATDSNVSGDIWSDPFINDWLIGKLSTSYFYAGSADPQTKIQGHAGCLGYLVGIDRISAKVEEILTRRSISEHISQCNEIISNPNKYRVVTESTDFVELVFRRGRLKKIINDESGLRDLEAVSAFILENGRISLSRNSIFEIQTWKFNADYEKYLNDISKNNKKIDPKIDASVACSIADYYIAQKNYESAKAVIFSYMTVPKQFGPSPTMIYPESFVNIIKPQNAENNLVNYYDDKRKNFSNEDMLKNFVASLIEMRNREGCNLPYLVAKIEHSMGDNSHLNMLLDLAIKIEKELNNYFITTGHSLDSIKIGNDTSIDTEFFFNDNRLSKLKLAMDRQTDVLKLLLDEQNKAPPTVTTSVKYITVADYAKTNKLEIQTELNGNWTIDAFNPGICGMEGIELQKGKIRIGTKWCKLNDVKTEYVLTDRIVPILATCANGERPVDRQITCDDPITDYIKTTAYLINYTCNQEAENTGTGLISLWVDKVSNDAIATSLPNFFNNKKATANLRVCK